MATLSCPNKSSVEWKDLVNSLGEQEAWRSWIRNDGEAVSPKEAAYQLFIDHNPNLASSVLSSYIDWDSRIKGEVSVEKTPLDLIRMANENLFKDPYFSSWITKEKFNLVTENPQPAKLYIEEEKSIQGTYGPLLSQYYTDQFRDYDKSRIDQDSLAQNKANEIAQNLANKLVTSLGIDNELISKETAEQLLADSKTPYKGQSAFFFAGKIYFVGDKIGLHDLLHEYSHPLLKAISLQNRALFNNLYNSLASSPESSKIIEAVKMAYPGLEEDQERFMLEVLSHGLERAALNSNQKIESSDNFKGFIKNIIYALKQALRKIFGTKIKIESLSPLTTLDQLGNMLKSEDFVINTDIVTDKEIADFRIELDKYLKELSKIPENETLKVVNRFYDVVSSETRKQIFSDEQKSMLFDVKKRLNKYQTVTDLKTKDVEKRKFSREKLSEIEIIQKQSTALMTSILTFEKVGINILSDLKSMISNDDMTSVQAIQKAYNYKASLDNWEGFIKESEDILGSPRLKDSLPANSEVFTVLSKLKGIVTQAKSFHNEIMKKNFAPFLAEQAWSWNETLTNNHIEQLEKIEKLEKDPIKKQERLDKENLEYHKLIITKEQIGRILDGNEGDINLVNGYLEDVMSIQSPVLGSFMTYYKNAMSEVDNNNLRNQTKLMTEISPQLKKAGVNYNPANTQELGNKLLFRDKRATIDSEGNIKEKQVLSYLSPHKNYIYDQTVRRNNLEKAREKGDEKEIARIIAENEQWKQDYFYQSESPEIANLEKIYLDTPLGQEALLDKEKITQAMNDLQSTQDDELEGFETYPAMESLLRDYSRLFSLTDLDGQPKTGDELAKAMIHREYREKTKPYYKWTLRKGDIFEKTLTDFEDQLEVSGVERDSDIFKAKVNEWISKNTRVKYTQEYYENLSRIIEGIKAITTPFNAVMRKDLDISEELKKLSDITLGYRDEDGQPMGNDMNPSQLAAIKNIQEKIIEAQDKLAGYSGLDISEKEELQQLYDILYKKKTFTSQESERFRELLDKKDELGIGEGKKATLMALYAELRELQSKVPTDYYLDVYNYYMGKMGEPALDKSNANDILTTGNIIPLMAKNKDFRDWFEANHIKRKRFDYLTKKEVEYWDRTYAWNVTIPNNPEYVQKTLLKRIDPSTGKPQVIQGIPSLRFFTKQLKQEYTTPKIVGVTVDNLGKWLPRTLTPIKVKTREIIEENPDGTETVIPAKEITLPAAKADSPYINNDYYKLKVENPAAFELLETMKRHLLEAQGYVMGGYTDEIPKGRKRSARQSRVWLDHPRIGKQGMLEYIQSGNLKKDAVSQAQIIIKGTANAFVKKAKDDYQAEGMNFRPEDQYRLVKADLLDNEINKIPVVGLADIDVDQVSMDPIHNMLVYMASIENQNKLLEINPLAKGLGSILNNDANWVKDLEKVKSFQAKHQGIIEHVKKGGKYNLREAYNAIYAREFLGQNLTGIGAENPVAQKLLNKLMTASSRATFALNIPSAIQNRENQIFNNIIEVSAGIYMSPKSYAEGRRRSIKAMIEYSSKEVYNKSTRGLDAQMIDVFDMIQGRFREKFGENSSRSLAKDIAGFTWLTSHRKWMDIESGLQVGFGMLAHVYVTQTNPDGSKKQIRYSDAWELGKDNFIKLKEGIDKEWDMNGKRFLDLKNKMHGVINLAHGALSKFDSALANRHLLFRMFSFMRRFWTKMFISRFGMSTRKGNFGGYRYDFNLATPHRGFYITALSSFKKLITTMGKEWNFLTIDEKRAMRKLAAEGIQVMLMSLAIGLIFGWDDEDPDRFAKRRALSGPLGSDDFELDGYMANHALNLLMRTKNESETFMPWPGLGLDSYLQFQDTSSIMFGNTTKTYGKIIYDLYGMLPWADEQVYVRDAGPYEWQKAGHLKLWNHLGTALGFTGSSVDPVKALKSFESVQNKYK